MTTLGLAAIAGTSRTDAWVLAATYQTALHWNGQDWQTVPYGGTSAYHALWPNRADDVWVVGNVGRVIRWDGTQWNALPEVTGGSLDGITGTSESDVWVISTGSHQVFHWNGATWTLTPTPIDNDPSHRPSAVWAATPQDVWMADTGGVILHWDGAQWEKATTPMKAGFTAIWGRAANDVWAVGSSGVTAHWNGETWSAIESPVDTILTSVWAAGPNDVWAVGRRLSGPTVLLRYRVP